MLKEGPVTDVEEGPVTDVGEGPVTDVGGGQLADVGRGPLADVGRGPLADVGRGPVTDVGQGPLTDVGRGPVADVGRGPVADVPPGVRGARPQGVGDARGEHGPAPLRLLLPLRHHRLLRPQGLHPWQGGVGWPCLAFWKEDKTKIRIWFQVQWVQHQHLGWPRWPPGHHRGPLHLGPSGARHQPHLQHRHLRL